MASHEDELRDLRQQNSDLAQKVQHWKTLASQREDEKLDLMKEINELRLKLSRLRSNGSVQANNLDSALQSAAQKALAHLVRASGEIATTMELTKAYMRDREELDKESPRWSAIGGTPATAKKDKVHRVPPLMIGGQSIQPVVALTMLDTSNARSAARSSNTNRNVTERAMPMHMLQDVYIPLTRIDMNLQPQLDSMETEDADNADDSTELLQLDDNEERVIEDSQRMDEDEDFESTRVLDAITEDSEPENDEGTPPRNSIDNPLEGPSWMLDATTSNNNQPSASKLRTNLEPDSTTELEDYRDTPPMDKRLKTEGTPQLLTPARVPREFSPTVRRRKRVSSPPPAAPTPRRSPHYSPRPAPTRRLSNSGRVLKVLVAKMRLDADGESGAGGAADEERGAGAEASPPKRAAPAALVASHAPSPNGATVPGLIVSETNQEEESVASGEPAQHRPRHQQPRATDNTDNTDNTDWNNDDDTQQHINTNRRTKSKQRNERTNSREKKQRSRDQMETESSDSMEWNERTNAENEPSSKEPKNGRERHKRNRDRSTETRRDTERNVDRERTDSAERSGSGERTDYRNKRSRSRADTHEDVRTDSRASDDSTRQHDAKAEVAEVAARGRAASCDSDSGSGGERDGRTRRTRKIVTYKEKPLNRKLRR